MEDYQEKVEKRQARMEVLLQKPVGELVRMIVALEDEVQKTKEYRKRLIQIRNLALDPGERRPIGRPRKETD